jgi:16S rRNA (cytosine1402-N4)-methyltransferase
LAIVSFHSGEDRIVKQTFREWREQGWVNILTKKPITPTDEEIGVNPRSRSAKLRIIEKI